MFLRSVDVLLAEGVASRAFVLESCVARCATESHSRDRQRLASRSLLLFYASN